ncbi:hypothetical protein AB0O91_36845 [Kitasatospora sp. NPDC089797]|uniref:hypothetical protein n=1 Tax=Kitasatospora sp. NPDC089797 TaxID=3155298 RepID=UPI00343066C8
MRQAPAPDPTGTAPPAPEALAELLAVREQLARLETSPLVTGAHRLARNFGPVLEPVWSLLATPDDGVGHLRQYGTGTTAPAARRANTAVAAKALRAYKKLKLVGPDRHQIWAALANPADTILAAVPVPAPTAETDHSPTTTLTAAVRPALPAALHLDHAPDTQLVPALRAVLRRWCDLAHRSGGTGGDHARIMLAAALLARGAALDGDTDTVRWFIDRWLGLNPLDTRVDGTTAALLENDWTRNRVDARLSQLLDTVTGLRTDADHQHRLHRPVWETQVAGHTVALLPQTYDRASTAADDPAELAASVPVAEQLNAVIAALSSSRREADIVTVLFTRNLSLADAAEQLGMPYPLARKLWNQALIKLRHPESRQFLQDYL